MLTSSGENRIAGHSDKKPFAGMYLDRLPSNIKLDSLSIAMAAFAVTNYGVDVRSTKKARPTVEAINKNAFFMSVCLLSKKETLKHEIKPVFMLELPSLRKILRHLLQTVPSLGEPMNVHARKLAVDKVRGQGTYYDIIFDDADIVELGEQQLDMWNAIEDLAGRKPDSLGWEPFDPNMRVAFADESVPETSRLELEDMIKDNRFWPKSDILLQPAIDADLLKKHAGGIALNVVG